MRIWSPPEPDAISRESCKFSSIDEILLYIVGGYCIDLLELLDAPMGYQILIDDYRTPQIP